MNPLRTLLIATSLLMLGVLGAQPAAAACTPPGTASGGVLGATEWYTRAVPYTVCTTEAQVEGAAGREAGELQTAAFDVINGAGDLVQYGALVAAAEDYANLVCVAVIGPTIPPCLADQPVSQTQWCPNGVTIPQVITGGIAGEALLGSNGILQGTCAFEGATESSVPDGGDVVAYASNSVDRLSTQAQNAAGDMATAAADGAGDLAEGSINDACIWLRGSPGCI